jgi:hypothetical protein
MKYVSLFFLSFACLLGFSAQASSAPVDLTEDFFDTELNTLQQSIDLLIAQSNMDPEIAQQLTSQIGQLNQQLQSNMQQDTQDIKVAAALTSFLEAGSNFVQSNTTLANFQSLFNSIKYAARMNTLQKLVLAACYGSMQNLPYYTDPYTETAGFTFNNWMVNGILQTALTGVKATIPGTTVALDLTSPVQAWTLQAVAGVIATFTWLLQKKLVLPAQS